MELTSILVSKWTHHNDIIYRKINLVYALHGFALLSIAILYNNAIHDSLAAHSLAAASALSSLIVAFTGAMSLMIQSSVEKVQSVRDCFNNSIYQSLDKEAILNSGVTDNSWFSNAKTSAPEEKSLGHIRTLSWVDFILVLLLAVSAAVFFSHSTDSDSDEKLSQILHLVKTIKAQAGAQQTEQLIRIDQPQDTQKLEQIHNLLTEVDLKFFNQFKNSWQEFGALMAEKETGNKNIIEQTVYLERCYHRLCKSCPMIFPNACGHNPPTTTSAKPLAQEIMIIDSDAAPEEMTGIEIIESKRTASEEPNTKPDQKLTEPLSNLETHKDKNNEKPALGN